jgi:hypothetical protein
MESIRDDNFSSIRPDFPDFDFCISEYNSAVL